MNEFVVVPVDCEPFVRDKEHPIVVVKRRKAKRDMSSFAPGVGPPPPGRWLVLDRPIDVPNQQAHWAEAAGDQISVTVFPYLTKTQSIPDFATACMQLGYIAARCLNQPPSARNVLYMFQGDVWQAPPPAEGFQIWAGFAFQIED